MPAPIAPPPGCDPTAIVLSFPVAREFAGLRVDQFIQRRIPRISRTRAAAIVRACGYSMDGRRLRPGSRVEAGKTVLLVRERLVEPECPRHFTTLYEDDDILAISKPPGLPMHPTATYHRNTLSYLLRERFGPDGPVIAHRLDRETSGLVVCAKNRAAERTLKGAFERREVCKEYLAVVRGDLLPRSGSINLPLGPVTEGFHVRMEVKAFGAGSPAVTRYQVTSATSSRSLVALFPQTGRQHQLRVHLAAIGHPIVGDKLYGPEGDQPFWEVIEQGLTPSLLRRLGHARHALHAQRVTLQHPRSGHPLQLEAPFPEDLSALLHL